MSGKLFHNKTPRAGSDASSVEDTLDTAQALLDAAPAIGDALAGLGNLL
jgi:hypothetical protein